MAQLNCNVYVTDSTGESFFFTPKDDVPVWAQKAITNPTVWAVEPDVEAVVPTLVDEPEDDVPAVVEVPKPVAARKSRTAKPSA